MLLIDERQVAAEGLDAMESWMREIGCVMTISELGCDESITSLLVFLNKGNNQKDRVKLKNALFVVKI